MPAVDIPKVNMNETIKVSFENSGDLAKKVENWTFIGPEQGWLWYVKMDIIYFNYWMFSKSQFMLMLIGSMMNLLDGQPVSNLTHI